MPLCCVAYYRDEADRWEGWQQFKRRKEKKQPHLGLTLADWAETDGGNHPIQASYCQLQFVIFPIARPERMTFHEPSLLDSKVVHATPAEAWDALLRRGKAGLEKLQAAPVAA
jgi:hypothetical protein